MPTSQRSRLPTIVATVPKRTFGTARRRPFAYFLTVLAKQLVGSDQGIVILGELLANRVLNRAIRYGIVGLLLGKTHSAQHSQPVRIECHQRIGAGKQEYLLCTRISDAGKLLQCFLRLGQRLLENGSQIAAELLIGNSGNGEKFLRTQIGEYSGFGDRRERAALGSENLLGTSSNVSLEAGERLGTALVVRQVCDIFPDDKL